MVTILTKQYKIVCERCGKTEYSDDHPESRLTPLSMGYNEVAFKDPQRTVANGGVCNECYKEFCEIAENFFDDVNKENEGGPGKKPNAILINCNARTLEVHCKCPLCGGTFDYTGVNPKDIRCPHCKAELEDIK